MTYRFVINEIPPSMNKYKGRSNIWEYRQDKLRWEWLIAAKCKGVVKSPIPKCVLELRYYFPTKIRHDPNNYDGQFITDGLVKAKVIQDDSFDCIKLVLTGGYDKENPRTEIYITEE